MNLKNSMILANMLSQNKIMYATIKGTLTENDGVFSRFSASNYLAIQDSIPTTNSFEYCFKFKTTIGTIQKIFGVNGSTSYNGISILANGSIAYTIKRTGGYTDITFDEIIISDNIEYILKINFNNGNFICSLYDTNGALIKTQTKTSSYTEEIGYDMVIGKGASRSFSGTIDLNRSYIKIGSTKYNLQAVVGYTVVGSPTITDGVVSGFSSGNYLQIANINNFKTNISFEFKIAFETSNVSLNTAIISSYDVIFRISYNKLEFVARKVGGQQQNCYGVTNLTNNTKYYAKIRYTLNKLELSLSTDDINYNLEKSIDIELNNASNDTLRIGYETQTIYINECYIKFNNKLWFNGQQA